MSEQDYIFFNARDVIFDEGSVLCSNDSSETLRITPAPHTSPRTLSPPINDTPLGSGGVIGEDLAHSSSIGADTSSDVPSSPTAASPDVTAPMSLDVVPEPRHSMCASILTEKGTEYTAEMRHQQDHLGAAHAAQAGMQLDDDNHDVSEEAIHVAMAEIADPLHSDEDHVNAAPDGQINLIITEQAHLSIHSDQHRNPTDPNYNMGIPPATYDEALKCSDHEDWLQAMQTELRLMKEMKIWELVEPPPGRKLVGIRWVFKFKTNDQKGGARFKAHLVAQGFSQVPGVDFHCTYAPVAHQVLIKILIALATMLDWELDCFDAK